MMPAHLRMLLALALGSTLLVALSTQHAFFWDAVLQASRYAHWYYDTGFRQLLVPEAYDTGHPPLFGIALAAVWRVAGVSLSASHWAMLPLVLGVLWQLYRLARRTLPAAWVAPGLLLAWLDPTWLTQSTLVSPDVPLTFGYLLALNGLRARRPWQVIAGSVPMVLVSSRGTLLLLALGLTVLLWSGLAWPRMWRRHGPAGVSHALLSRLWPLLPAAAAVAGWLLMHYQLTGWVGYHAGSPWAQNTSPVSPTGVLRNVVIIGWRLLDHGRAGLWLVAAVAAAQLWRRGWRPTARTRQLLALWLPPVLLVSGTMVWYANPIGHRYYLLAYLLFALLVTHFLSLLPQARLLALGAGLLLLSGHAWVYPDRVANGWDATLAHRPYFGLRQQLLRWLQAQRIPLSQVGSSFPNAYPLRDTDLAADTSRFAPVDLGRNRYVLQSNVMNFGDAVLDSLEQNWRVVREERAGQVYFRLYERK